ncbi:MAG: glycoside hydrolase family 92 protein, partial [Burkholderiales bacterium]|nr:glycoside hydrolase family 92 protein [Opitutaceae bacterium]
PARLVDPLAGTDGGSLVPGPVAPYGLVWLSPDRPFPQNANGYDSRAPILGFSHTHVSGTGGGAGYGNIRVTPQSGPLILPPRPSAKSAETAHAGYYAVTLDDAVVRAELTTEPRVGHHRYTFAPGAPARLLIDVASTLARNAKARDEVSVCLASTARIVSERRIEGSASFLGGVWSGGPYEVFFAAEFDQPFTRAGVWRDDQPLETLQLAEGKRVGAYAEFAAPPDGVVGLRVGLSFKNLANARTALTAAAPDFDTARAAAEQTWARTLAVIEIEGATDAQRRLFSTALYRCFTMPTDLTGDNPRWDSTEPHYWHYFAVWDTFRSLNPLLTLVAPERQRDLLRSLLDTSDHTGWLPDSWISGNAGRIQGGNNAHILFADAYVKKLPGIDYAKAYAAMIKDAETPLPPTRARTQGRHEVEDYARRGYLTDAVRNSGSVTLEYAYNDYAIATLAAGLGHSADAARYLERSQFAFNLFNPETRSFWTRAADGQWTAGFIPDYQGKPIWEGPYYEGTPREYGASVPHDMDGLIQRYGGPAAFVAYLDELFD